MGRFLQTDPIGTTNNQNPYLYATNDSLNAIDALGEAVEIIRTGNKITLNFYNAYRGPGASPQTIARFNRGIERAWTGTFGKYEVTANVLSPTVATPRSLINYIEVPSTGDRATVHNVRGTIIPGNTGSWPASVTSEWAAAHEAGHLAGLIHSYLRYGKMPRVITNENEPDIMDLYGYPVIERTIEEVLEINMNRLPTSSKDSAKTSDVGWDMFDGLIIGNSCSSIRLECR